jgi:transcription antitermination factor NusG
MSIAARAVAAIRQPNPTIPISYPAGGAWYAYRTAIKGEWRAKYGIEALGFETFMPMERRAIIRRRRKVLIESPLFARYGFVHFDIHKDEWGEIHTIDGIESLLTNNQIPVRVPTYEIDQLKLAAKFGLFDRTKKPDPFKPGDEIKIEEGPFSGFIGKVIRARTGDRVDILLNFFGSMREIELPLLQIRANQI